MSPAQLAQEPGLVTAQQLGAGQRAEHLRPKQRDAFGVVFGFEGVVSKFHVPQLTGGELDAGGSRVGGTNSVVCSWS